MKTPERVGSPAVGNAVGLLIGLWAIDKFDWLPVEQSEFIVAACGTLCIHALIEGRSIISWIASRYEKKQ